MIGPPVDPYAATNALANRIAQYLKAHPDDAEARQDLRVVVSLMQRRPKDTTALDNPPEPSVGAQVRSGLVSAAADIPKGILGAILNPVQTAGQLTGVGNIKSYLQTARDPNASNAEKIAAVVQATPLNAGYAPARAFLQSLGHKTDEPPAPLSEQVRQGGDIAASLLLMRYGGPAGKRLAQAGDAALLGAPGRVWRALRAKPPVAPIAEPAIPAPEAAIRTQLTQQGFSPENIEQLVQTWRQGGNPAPIAIPPPTNTPPVTGRPSPLIESGGPLDVPTYQRRGLLEPNPLQATDAEAGATAAAKALRVRAREAARNAYTMAITAGQTVEQATAAAKRAAGTVMQAAQ